MNFENLFNKISQKSKLTFFCGFVMFEAIIIAFIAFFPGLWEGQGRAKFLLGWGHFLLYYRLLLNQLSKISNQMDFRERLSDLAQIFYEMAILLLYYIKSKHS